MPDKQLPPQAAIGDANGAMAVGKNYQQRDAANGEHAIVVVDGALTVNVRQTTGDDYATVNDAGKGNVRDVFIRQGAGNDTATVFVPGSTSTGIVRDVVLNGGAGFNEAVIVMDRVAGRISLSDDGQSLVYSDPHNHIERLSLGDYSMVTVAPKTSGEEPNGRFETLHFDTAQLVELLRHAPNQSMRVRELMGNEGIDARSYD